MCHGYIWPNIFDQEINILRFNIPRFNILRFNILRYVIGFCESILDLCNAKIDGFTGIIDGGINDVRFVRIQCLKF